jgi:Asp-tRNA(Asn)/Glu-tRNA(Gln) amidotransferase A subunit family amidase
VNATGLPAVSVPGTPAPDGLPIGVQLVGRHGDDAMLMALAAEYEEAQPWAARWPALADD